MLEWWRSSRSWTYNLGCSWRSMVSRIWTDNKRVGRKISLSESYRTVAEGRKVILTVHRPWIVTWLYFTPLRPITCWITIGEQSLEKLFANAMKYAFYVGMYTCPEFMWYMYRYCEQHICMWAIHRLIKKLSWVWHTIAWYYSLFVIGFGSNFDLFLFMNSVCVKVSNQLQYIRIIKIIAEAHKRMHTTLNKKRREIESLQIF